MHQKKYYIFQVIPNNNNLGHGIIIWTKTKQDFKNLCLLQRKLFSIYLKNDHHFLSTFQRSVGTNFSKPQRIACFGVYFSTLMAGSAIFYAIKQRTLIWWYYCIIFGINHGNDTNINCKRKILHEEDVEEDD